MFERWFDDFARAAAGGTSRRQALKQIGGVVGAAVVAALPAQALADPGGNSACAHFCHQVFSGEAAGDCTSQAAHGTGPCYQCGPAAVGTGLSLCGQTCLNLQADVANCGACGHACTTTVPNAHATCVAGVCSSACNGGYTLCNGACVSNVCPDGQVLHLDTCTCQCPAGTTNCGGSCVSLATDVNNCGACGNVCQKGPNATGVVCGAGVCRVTGCEPGFADCDRDASNGCEANPMNGTDINNCGGCGYECHPPDGPYIMAAICVSGECSFICEPGYTRCGNGTLCCTSCCQTPGGGYYCC